MPEQENIFRAFLQMAVFCEKVLREADGVMSIIVKGGVKPDHWGGVKVDQLSM